MNGMIWKFAAMQWLLGAGALAAAENVRVTEVMATDGSEARFALVDAADPDLKRELVLAMNSEFKGQVYVQARRDGSGGGLKQDADVGPVVMAASHSGSMRHSAAGRDFLAGAAMCVGACMFVQVAGEDMADHQQPEGLYVTAGDKFVEGGAAAIPCLLGSVGLIFMGRGAIEAFLPDDSYTKIPAPETTEQILADGHLKKIQSVGFDSETLSREELKRQVLMYCVSTL